MAKNKCSHLSYKLVDGQLVCSECGEPSPRAKLVGDKFVRIGEKEIRCPKCGEVVVAARAVEEVETKPIRLKK